MSMSSSSSTATVTFCDGSLNKVHEFDKVEEFERPLIWWSFSDFARFRSLCNTTVRALRSDDGEQECAEEQDKENFYCMRGLENWGGKECRERRARIKKAVWLVIDGQRELFDEGIVDGFACAEMYQQHCADMRIQAHVRGVQDEEALLWHRVDEFVQEDDETSPASSEVEQKISQPLARIKRRRSSGEKMKAFSTSLKNFARKVSSSSAA